MSTGFNLLSLKKETTETFKTIYRRNVVVGEDLFSVALVMELVKKYGEENVLWICPRMILKQDLMPLGPTLLRGEANIAKFKKAFPDVSCTEIEAPSQFFKELKWRKFGGRSKPEPLQWNESFYIEKRADFEISELFPFLKEEGFFEKLESLRYKVDVKSMRKTLPDDLAEPNHFEITLSDNDRVKCERLYWGDGAENLLYKYEDKNELSDDFITFCESSYAPSALYLRFVFDKPITEKKATLFIPLSYTHEWGHFIGEFHLQEDGTQVANFVTFMDIQSTNEDEISKKIRLLKKNFEKIFGESGAQIKEEFIKLASYSPCLKIDDILYGSLQKDWANLMIASFNAPLEYSGESDANFEDSEASVSTLVRGALRHQEILQTFQ